MIVTILYFRVTIRFFLVQSTFFFLSSKTASDIPCFWLHAGLNNFLFKPGKIVRQKCCYFGQDEFQTGHQLRFLDMLWRGSCWMIVTILYFRVTIRFFLVQSTFFFLSSKTASDIPCFWLHAGLNNFLFKPGKIVRQKCCYFGQDEFQTGHQLRFLHMLWSWSYSPTT